MLLTITPNAAVDITYRVDGFQLNRVHRPAETRTLAGGKGINVARVYRELGGQAFASGFLGGRNGRLVARSLQRQGIPGRFARTAGESRTCICIVDPLARTQTEVNEPGPEVSAHEVERLCALVRRLLGRGGWSWLVLCGSLPPGAPPWLYAHLIETARRAGVPAALDASGEALREGLAARPALAKPNLVELGHAAGRALATLPDALEAARRLRGTGIERVVVTLGGDGAFCVGPRGEWRCGAPAIRFVSAVGSGDSFLAAYLWALDKGQGDREALVLGVGAGAANAEVYGAGLCSRERILGLADQARPAEIRPGAR